MLLKLDYLNLQRFIVNVRSAHSRLFYIRLLLTFSFFIYFLCCWIKLVCCILYTYDYVKPNLNKDYLLTYLLTYLLKCVNIINKHAPLDYKRYTKIYFLKEYILQKIYKS